MSIRLQETNISFGYFRDVETQGNSTYDCSGCGQYNHTLQKFSRDFTCPGQNPLCPIVLEFFGNIHRDINPCVNILFWNCYAFKNNLEYLSRQQPTHQQPQMENTLDEPPLLDDFEKPIDDLHHKITDHRPIILGSGFLNLGN